MGISSLISATTVACGCTTGNKLRANPPFGSYSYKHPPSHAWATVDASNTYYTWFWYNIGVNDDCGDPGYVGEEPEVPLQGVE